MDILVNYFFSDVPLTILTKIFSALLTLFAVVPFSFQLFGQSNICERHPKSMERVFLHYGNYVNYYSAALNMRKLQLFRQFYLMVVAYIYFTRIIVFLVDATLPFRTVWLGDFFTELATLIFFCVTGYKFRPASDNPYFSLDESENMNNEIEL